MLSVAYTHWAMDAERSSLMRRSIESLIETLPLGAECIVCDNGGSLPDSEFLLGLAECGDIAAYVRFRNNMGFGYARNLAIEMASLPFVAVVDNDIEFLHGWAEECIDLLEANPEIKLFATPLEADPMNQRAVRFLGELDGWRLNTRAGSNCFVGRRSSFLDVGPFGRELIAGSRWATAYTRKGYAMAVMPNPKAFDLGLRNGMDFKRDLARHEL